MRIGGIASGLDTESIIKNLMKVERQPLNRLHQRKQIIEWQRDAFREKNLLLKNLDDAALKIRFSPAFNTRQANVSNNDLLSATTNASVRNGTYNINVDKVAKTERFMSSEAISSGTKLDLTKSIKSELHLTEETFTIKTAMTEENGKEFKIEGKSLDTIMKEINSTNIGVRVHYDAIFDRIIFERTETGIHNENGPEMELSGDFFSKLKINVDVTDAENNKSYRSAQNASYRFSNSSLGLESEVLSSKSNNISIAGLNLTVKDTGISTITVSSNTDTAFNNVKSFIDKYNETIEAIRTSINEKVHRGFPPLTDEQRRDMTEREVELWDEKAKSGLLSRDRNLTSALSQMRINLYTPVTNSGQYSQLTQIGISTSSNYLEGGKLEIDEKRLRDALENDPESVHLLLNNVANSELTSIPRNDRTTEQNQLINNQTGLVGRLRQTISSTIEKLVDHAGRETRTNQQFVLGRNLIEVDKRIVRFERRLSDIENRYWTQFTAMEKAMNQANAQASSFMQQIMGAGNS
jgi:flagellar hook-associated protein 2